MPTFWILFALLWMILGIIDFMGMRVIWFVWVGVFLLLGIMEILTGRQHD